MSETFLRQLSIRDYPNHYLLTPFESPVSVMSQQTRAMNLVHALLSCGVVAPGKRIGIIGAGAAGVTAAAFAAYQSCPVTILEKEPLPLSRFEYSDRYLHPRLFDWPAEGWDHDNAELPVMSWKAGPAWKVAQSLRDQWEGWCATYSFQNHLADARFLEYEGNAVVFPPQKQRSALATLRWGSRNSSVTHERKDLAAILITIGLGSEKKPTEPSFRNEWTDYWKTRESDLQRKEGRIYVSGNGDGAIADLFLVAFDKQFYYTELIELIKKHKSVTGKARIIEKKLQIANGNENDASIMLTSEYRALLESEEEFSKAILEFMRPKVVKVLVSGKTSEALHPRAYPINRLLLATLLRLERVDYRGAQAMCWRAGPILSVEPDKAERESIAFDHVIVRTGIRRHIEDEFPSIYQSVERDMTAWSRLQLTRNPRWSAPVALAIAHDAPIDFPVRPRKGACYSDFLDPWIQRTLLETLEGDVATFKALYIGRLRLLSLFHSEILVNGKQFIDGTFFHKLDGTELDDLMESLPIRIINESLIEMVTVQKPHRNRRSWIDNWIQDGDEVAGTAKPCYFFCLDRDVAVTTLENLQQLSARGIAWNSDAIVRFLEQQAPGLRRAHALSTQLSSLPTEVSKSEGRFRISELYDPGWLYEQLDPGSRDLLTNLAPTFLLARRPRQEYLASTHSVGRNCTSASLLESWFGYAYNNAIATAEKVNTWETVWTEACEWTRWGLNGSDEEAMECGSGLPMHALGTMTKNTWMDLKASWKAQVNAWYCGELEMKDILTNMNCELGQENPMSDSTHKKDRRVQAWLTGEYQMSFRRTPRRATIDERSPLFVLSERSKETRHLLSVTQFRSHTTEALELQKGPVTRSVRAKIQSS